MEDLRRLDRMFDDLTDKEEDRVVPKKVTHVSIIIDSSGSMGWLRDFVISTFNDQLEVFRKETDVDMETRVSITTFSDEITFKRWEEDVKEIKALEMTDYLPSGNTALYDAIGHTCMRLEELPDAKDENTSFLLIIITDGMENASRGWNQKTIGDLTKRLQDTKRWTITYYGTEPSKMNKDMNVFLSNTMVYNAQDMMSGEYKAKLTSSTENYMSARKLGATYTTSFYDDSTGKSLLQEEEEKKVLNTLRASVNEILQKKEKDKK